MREENRTGSIECRVRVGTALIWDNWPSLLKQEGNTLRPTWKVA